MPRLTLVFTIYSVIIAVAHFALVNGEAAPDQLGSPIDDQEEASERSGQRNALVHNYGHTNGAMRLRPVIPYPLNPAPILPPKYLPDDSSTCYTCRGCEKVNSTTRVASCRYYKGRTGCVTYSVTNSRDVKPFVIRDCISELGTCELIRKNWHGLGRIHSCTECHGNKCNDKNGAGSAAPNHFIAAMAMLAAPILTKVFFSRM